jgi:hypothetical protein
MAEKARWPYAYGLLAGGCDALTGLMLLAAPGFTLGLMRISQLPADLIYVRWIGAFVFGVGFTYVYPFLLAPGRLAARLAVALEITAVIRLAVFAFVICSIAKGPLGREWATVAITDLALAFFQFIMLKRGVFRHAG